MQCVYIGALFLAAPLRASGKQTGASQPSSPTPTCCFWRKHHVRRDGLRRREVPRGAGHPRTIGDCGGAPAFIALLGSVLKYTESQTYLLYLLRDTIWTWEFSHRQRPEWDQRIDRF